MNTTQQFLTVEQAAARLQLDPYTVRRRLREGSMPGQRIGGNGPWRIDPSQLDAYIRGEWKPAQPNTT